MLSAINTINLSRQLTKLKYVSNENIKELITQN